MNKLLFATAIALLCVQLLHASPTKLFNLFNIDVSANRDKASSVTTSTKSEYVPFSERNQNYKNVKTSVKDDDSDSWEERGKVFTQTTSTSSDGDGKTSKQTVVKDGNTVTVSKTSSSSSNNNSGNDGSVHYGEVVTKTTPTSSDGDGKTSKQTVVKDGNTVVVTKTTSTTATATNDRCEAEINKLNAQILELTRQLQQKDIDYNSLNVDFKSAKSDNSLLQSKLNIANAETQSWKSQFEALTINFRQTTADKVKFESSLKESLTSIVILEQTIVDIQVNIKKVNAEATQCKADLKVSQKESSVYSVTNTDLNVKVKDAADKLTRCQNENTDFAHQNSALKTCSEDFKKSLSTCQDEKTSLSESLKVKMANYNEEDRKIQENMATIKTAQSLLEQCKVRNTELEASSKSQKASVDDLTKKITVIRTEYDEQIKRSLDNLNQCKTSLQSETNQRTAIEIVVNTLKIQITEIQTKFDITFKAADEANAKVKQYQADSNGFKVIIDQLKSTMKDTSTELSKCTTAKTKCENNSQTTVFNLQQTIADIQNKYATLSTDSTKCISDLDVLRKEATAYKTSITDLNNNIKDVTDKLTRCHDDGDATALQIISLKASSDQLREKATKCEADLTLNINLSESLKTKIAYWENDEVEDKNKLEEEMARLRSTEEHLQQCEASKKQIVASYDSEKVVVFELTKKIAANRAEFDVSIRKYEERNNRTLDDFKQCQISLKSEIEYKVTIDIEVKTLRTQVIEFQNRLDITIQTVEKANTKAKKFEDDSNGLKVVIDQLKYSVSDKDTELTKCAAEKTNCNVNLKDKQSIIVNLEQTIADIKNINIKIDGDSSKCKLDLEDSNKQTTSYKATIEDLNAKVTDFSGKLTGCLNDDHKAALEILTLKSTIDKINKDVKTCEGESELLKNKIVYCENDEIEDENTLKNKTELLTSAETRLKLCEARNIEVEASYESVTVNVLNLTKKIAQNRGEYDDSIRKCTEEVQSSQDNLKECKGSLQTEIDVKISFETQVKKLEIRFTEIQSSLEASIKNVDEADSKTKRCEADSNGKTATIDDLNATLAGTTAALTKCAQHSASLQNDLTDSESRRDQYKNNLENSQSTIYTLQQTISDLTNINKKLGADTKQCQIDLVASQNESGECSATNTELNNRIKDITGKLTNCESDDYEAARKIIDLKSTVDNLNKDKETCEGKNVELSKSVQVLKELYEQDEANDKAELQAEMVRLRSTEELLKKCTTSKDDFESSYKNEKANVAKLTDTIGTIRAECAESRKTYDVQIERVNVNLNECKGSLKSQTEIVSKLNVKITEIQFKLDVSIKNVNLAIANTKRCEVQSKSIKALIDQQTSTIRDKTSELTRCGAEKSKCEVNLKDSRSTTVTQQKTIENLQTTNTKLTADTKLCKTNLEVSQKKGASCTSTNTDLNNRIKNFVEKLNSCESENHKSSLEIHDLKSSSDDLRKNLTNCREEETKVSGLLTSLKEFYEKDEIDDEKKLQEEIARLRCTKELLDQCKARNKEIDESYESSKANVLKLTNKIEENRAQCDKASKQYASEIEVLVKNSNQCTDSLKAESDEKESIKIDVSKLVIQIAEIKNQFEMSLKAVDDANSKTKQCEDDSNGLKDVIEGLRHTLADTSAERTKYERQSASLQNDVTDYSTRLDKCNLSVKDSESTISTLQQTIENTQKTNKKLNDDTEQCKRDLESTQKDSSTCRGTNDDLNSKIKDVFEQLKDCRNNGHEDALEIITLKSNSDDIKKSLSGCQTDNINLTESVKAYKVTIAKFNDEDVLDKLTINQGIVQQTANKALLDQCEASKTEIVASYEKTKGNVLDLTKKIASIRSEYDETGKKSDEKINGLITDLNKCETSFKSESDAVKDLDTEITELKRIAGISQKTIDEANSNIERCENDSNNKNVKIEQLTRTVTDQTNTLTKCEENATSLQDNLTERNSKLGQCDVNLENSQSTIDTLQNTIKEIEDINKKLDADTTQCKIDLVASENESHECSANNAELNSKIKDTTDKLTSCESDDYEAARKIIDLKSTVDNLNKDKETCEGKNVELSKSVEVLKELYEQDEANDKVELQAEMVRLRSTEELLKMCTTSKDDFESSYKNEKASVAKLTDTIGTLRAECAESRKTYDVQIESVNVNLNECKGSLKSQTDIVSSQNIQITEIQFKLDVSIKDINEANSNTKRCEDQSKDLKVIIDKQTGTIEDKTTELTRCGAEKSKCEINLEHSQSNTDTLQKTIDSLQDTNTKLTTDTKQCNIDLVASQNEGEACTSINTDLKKNIHDTVEILNSCESENHKSSLEIHDLKSSSDDLRNNLSDCREEETKNLELLKSLKEFYEKDEIDDENKLQEEIARLRCTKELLDKCKEDNKKSNESYESERANVLNLTKKIEENRLQCNEASKQSAEKIEVLNKKSNQCTDSLKTESDEKATIQSKVTTLEVEITEIRKQLDVSKKAVDDAKSETKQCEDFSNVLNDAIVELKRTVKDQSIEITKHEQKSTSLQNDLTDRESKLDKCNTNFVLSQSTIDSLKQTITDIEKINTRLDTDTTQCKHDLEASLQEAGTCSHTNVNLNIKITDIAGKLSSCEDNSDQIARRIISLQSSSDDLKTTLLTCQNDNTRLSETLKAKTDEYNVNEESDVMQIQTVISDLRTVTAQHEQCKKSKDEIEASYRTQKDNVADLTNIIARVRAEFTESNNNNNQQIQQLLFNLSQCRSTLQSESNVKATIEFNLKNLEIQFNEIQNRLGVSEKAVDEANANRKTCEVDKEEVNTELSSLRCAVNTHLKFVKEREAAAYQSFNDNVDKFVGVNNIQCAIRG